MGIVHLSTARAVGRDIASMRRFHGDSFAMYEFAQPHVRGKVLDIACGTGVGARFLTPLATEVIGVDIDTETIAYCKKHHKIPHLSFILADATKQLPFPDNHFDTIVTFETIEHLYPQERQKYLAQLHRVLKEDGTVLLSTPQNGIEKQTTICAPPKHPYDHKIEFSLRELRDEIKKAGFTVTREGGILYTLNPKGSRVHSAADSARDRLRVRISKMVPPIIKEQIGHRIFGFPHDIKHYAYVEKDLEHTNTFFLVFKKTPRTAQRKDKKQ